MVVTPQGAARVGRCRDLFNRLSLENTGFPGTVVVILSKTVRSGNGLNSPAYTRGVLPRQRRGDVIQNFSRPGEVFLFLQGADAMATKEKELLVKELTEKLKDTSAVVVTEYQGLTVAELSELRAKLRAIKCEYTVVKNTLGRIALKNIGLDEFTGNLGGPTAIAIQKGDPVGAAKALLDFSKDHAKLKIKTGLLGTKVMSVAEIKALAALPSREVLIAKVLGTMQAPISGLVNVMQGNIRNVVYVLEAVKNQKAKA